MARKTASRQSYSLLCHIRLKFLVLYHTWRAVCGLEAARPAGGDVGLSRLQYRQIIYSPKGRPLPEIFTFSEPAGEGEKSLRVLRESVGKQKSCR